MNKYQQILTRYWGYSEFRPLQEEIIRSIAEDKKDTLGLLPTGGGKSIIFQVPAMATDGICLVITPLIALMKDQVENLKRRKIKAVAIYSGMSKTEIDITLNNCIYGDIRFLYVSPERLATEIFLMRLPEMKVNLVAIDEAHCISQWGYDFRPSYLKIANIKKLLPEVPFLALTATATAEVVDDIQEKLLFKQKNVFRKSFNRQNLCYIVRQVQDKNSYLLKIAKKMNSSGIVYVRSRKKTVEVADFLNRNGVSADYYHAGLSNESKDYKQAMWKNGKCKVICSTNAFGMGIDKPDVRFVVHIDLPDSLEAYFQEAGRAGRDEQTAYAVLLYDKSDIGQLRKNLTASFPERAVIKQIYNALGNFYQIPVGSGKDLVFDFKLSEFVSRYKLSIVTVYSCLKILQHEAYLELTEELNNPSRVLFTVQRDDLYKFQVANTNFDKFIKLLLRSYTGLFTEFTKIDEDFLAKKAGTTRDVIYNYLKKLSTLKIIDYIPQKKTPLLIYTSERLDDKSLIISKEKYENRKNHYQTKIDAVINYAESTAKCRSQLLLEYFGDTTSVRCGQCDVCTRRNELDLSKYEFDMIIDLLKQELKYENKELELKELVTIVDKNEDKVIKVIQWLLDNEKIRYTATQKLKWI